MPLNYNPPPSPWSVAGRGLLGVGDYIRDVSERRKRDVRIKALDERQAKLDEAEGIDRAINRARLGVVEVDPSDPQGRAIGRDAIRAQGVEPPSLDPKSLAQDTIPPHLGGLAGASLRGEPLPGLGGSEPSTAAPKAFSAGDYLRGLKPPAMESDLQRIAGAESLYIDPSRTPEGRQRAEREAERTAELARVEQERKRARDAAYQSAISAGASEPEAASFADAQAVGVTPYSYAPRTREQMFADLRERERIENPQGGGRRLTPVQERASAEEEALGIARTLTQDERFKNHEDPLAFVRSNLRVQFADRLPEGVIQGIALDATQGAQGGDKSTTAIRNARARVQQMKSLAEVGTPQSDVAFLFSFMKLIDDGGVVREGDIALLQSASSLKERAEIATKRGEGAVLTKNMRQKYLEAAEAIAGGLGGATAPSEAGSLTVPGGQATNDDLLSKYGLTPRR
jgi:hypothetical protein